MLAIVRILFLPQMILGKCVLNSEPVQSITMDTNTTTWKRERRKCIAKTNILETERNRERQRGHVLLSQIVLRERWRGYVLLRQRFLKDRYDTYC